jgi:alkylation response protein AidB-like acyl-CoA dehydrogenase
VAREVWTKAGENGFLCMTMPEEYGGAVRPTSCIRSSRWKNCPRRLHRYWLQPAQRNRGALHPALRHRSEQKAKYLPKLASGEMVGAIAMSEPAAGSDLQGVKTTAIQQADGSYLLNGSKTFITNGWHADLVIVVAKTNPAAGGKGTSLLLVERGMPGF